MFEQAYVVEFDECVRRDVGAVRVVRAMPMGLPLASIADEQSTVADVVHTSAVKGIFGNAWPGLIIACG